MQVISLKKTLPVNAGFVQTFQADNIDGYNFVSYIGCATNGVGGWIGALDGYIPGSENLGVYTTNASGIESTGDISIKAYSLYERK